MSFATTVIALALVGGTTAFASAQPARVALASAPKPACTAPVQTGIFRITATKPDGSGVRPAMIVLENIDGCLEVTLVTDEATPAVIDHLSFSGDTLTGTVRTGGGDARISLSFDTGGAGVAGSITDGRQHWLVKGRRTS